MKYKYSYIVLLLCSFTVLSYTQTTLEYSGQVVDNNSSVGISGAKISFYNSNWEFTASDTTDNTGNFGGVITTVEEDFLPTKFELSQNYPNPFSDKTIIDIKANERISVTVEIYNILGQKVRSFSIKEINKGAQKFEWNGRDGYGRKVAKGIYFAKINGGSETKILKMIYGLSSSSSILSGGVLSKRSKIQTTQTYNLVTEKEGYKTDTTQVTLPNTNISIPLDEIIKSEFNFSVEDLAHADSLAEGLTTVQIGDSIFVSQNSFVSGRMPAGTYSLQVSNDSMHKVWKFEGNDGQWDRYFPDNQNPKIDLSHNLDGRIRMVDKDFDKDAWKVRWVGHGDGSAYWGPHPEKDFPVIDTVFEEMGLSKNEDSTTIKFYLWTQKNGNLPEPFNGYYAGDDFWDGNIVEFRPISDSEAQRLKTYFETTFNDFLDNKFNIEVIIGDEQNLPLKHIKNIGGYQGVVQKEGWHILQGGRYNAHYQSCNTSLDPENRIFSARSILRVLGDNTVSPTGYLIEAAQSQGVLFDGAGDPYPITNDEMTDFNDFGKDGQRINLNMGRQFRFFDNK